MVVTDAAPAAALPAELAKVLARIGRGLRYRTRAVREALDVTQSEGELLRLLERRPGIRVQDAAPGLGIASNSVRTLVTRLSRNGLVQRASDPLDGRAACLWLTPQSQDWVARIGSAREEALAKALASLGEAERKALEAAVPAMVHLSKAIVNRGGAAQ